MDEVLTTIVQEMGSQAGPLYYWSPAASLGNVLCELLVPLVGLVLGVYVLVKVVIRSILNGRSIGELSPWYLNRTEVALLLFIVHRPKNLLAFLQI
jgi:hypothetical protein